MKAAFTLIEVLASMAVLVILILALTRMFMEATSITKRGTAALMRNSTAETAMETLLQDAEGLVVSDRLACYVKADVTDPKGFGFDEAWFISTSGDQDDDLPYEYFHFYVTNKTYVNTLGAAYLRFDLIKERMIFAVGDAAIRPNRFYAMDTNHLKWWESASKIDVGSSSRFTVWDRQVLADNVVRFDIYCTGWDGTGWMGGFSGVHQFDSTKGPNNKAPTNVPPAAFDIYLQVASPEASIEGGMALLSDDELTRTKGREALVRESSSVFGRAVPLIGAARYNTAVIYGTNNTAYYED